MSLVTLSTAKWTPIGPAPIQTLGGLDEISGRIQAAAPDPTDPNTIYLGGDNGGIWKNVNPPNWTPLTDHMPSLNFGGYHPLVVHPANHDLVLGLVSGPGAGILQSLDAGKTWHLLANSQFDGQALNSIAVHPTDTKAMYLAASWFGAWKSSDGGSTWQQMTALPGGSVWDLIIAKFDPKTLYAAVVGNTGAQQAQNGVYKSIDSGASWTLLGGLPSGAALGGDNASGAVRIESGTAVGVVYVSMLTVGPNPSPPPALAVTAIQRFRTGNGGTSWTALAASPGGFEKRSWHLLLAVDPADGDHVFVNDAYSLWESKNAGKKWTQADAGIGYLKGINHFDWVNLTFDANDKAVVTADQGVLRYDPAKKSWTSLMGNLQVSEFYTIGLDPSTASVAYAVGQDIFCEKFTGQTEWNVMEAGIGETGKIIVDPKNINQLFGFNPLDTANFVMQSPDAGVTWTTVFPAALLSASFLKTYNQSSGYGFAYLSQKAFAMDRSNPARLLVVADRVFETTNSGGTWTQISGVLSKDPNNPFVAALAIAPSDGSTVYASTQDGRLWVTHDDGATWTERDSGLSGVVLDIRIDPNDPNHVFAVTGNDVWHLPPSGLPWVKVSGSIPGNLGLYTVFVAWEPAIPALFVGTDRGIYRSFDLGASWAKWGQGFPNTRVNDLQGELRSGQLLLAAATYGRGAWEILLKRWGSIATAIADAGNFGNVCVGSFADELLTINNNGWGPLRITNIASSAPEFEPPSVVSYPLLVGTGDSIDVVIRFRPASLGSKSGTITIFSDDPAGPHKVAISGTAPAPRLTTLIADAGSFGKVCVDSFRDQPLTLLNSGRCTLTIANILSSSGEFLVPQVLSYPFTIGAGDAVDVPIRFQPTGFGAKSATITVASDDPSSPKTIAVSGDAPPGKLVVTGSLCFGGVKACCVAERTLSICNMGECNLHVTGVALKRKHKHWKLVNNPFPQTLRPGSCLGVVVRYKATEKCPRACELVISSDDPVTPVKHMDLLAYTIWNGGGCKQCCDDCKKGCCDKGHTDRCCCGDIEDGCCDEDEDDDKHES
ncbi:MAG TPA: choice-of-anchor D domain-containing protein [Stellaceae bacterium]|nr:choice-of-anchor D domain-containing protein [Stellaceae bacterium]